MTRYLQFFYRWTVAVNVVGMARCDATADRVAADEGATEGCARRGNQANSDLVRPAW
jgi:hypothetical protein